MNVSDPNSHNLLRRSNMIASWDYSANIKVLQEVGGENSERQDNFGDKMPENCKNVKENAIPRSTLCFCQLGSALVLWCSLHVI